MGSSMLNIVAMHQAEMMREQLISDSIAANTARSERKARAQKVSQQLRDILGAEGYRTWWNSAPEQGFLEAAEEKLAEVTSHKLRICAGKVYRRVIIWRDADGVFVIREDGQVVPFVSEKEARGFIDAAAIMSGSLMVAGGARGLSMTTSVSVGE